MQKRVDRYRPKQHHFIKKAKTISLSAVTLIAPVLGAAPVSAQDTVWHANSVENIRESISTNFDNETNRYTVQWGDTVNTIAEAFNINANTLIKDNNISNANLIYAGEKLTITSDRSGYVAADTVVANVMATHVPATNLQQQIDNTSTGLSQMLNVLQAAPTEQQAKTLKQEAQKQGLVANDQPADPSVSAKSAELPTVAPEKGVSKNNETESATDTNNLTLESENANSDSKVPKTPAGLNENSKTAQNKDLQEKIQTGAFGEDFILQYDESTGYWLDYKGNATDPNTHVILKSAQKIAQEKSVNQKQNDSTATPDTPDNKQDKSKTSTDPITTSDSAESSDTEKTSTQSTTTQATQIQVGSANATVSKGSSQTVANQSTTTVPAASAESANPADKPVTPSVPVVDNNGSTSVDQSKPDTPVQTQNPNETTQTQVPVQSGVPTPATPEPIQQGVDVNKTVQWFYNREGKLTYSMYGSRNGTDGTADCSGAVTQAIYDAGGTKPAYLYNTDTLHDYLKQNDYRLVSNNQDWNAKKGDVVIWGKQGYSSGAAGHVSIISTDDPNAKAISVNYVTGGQRGTAVTEEDYNQFAQANNYPYTYAYRHASVQ